MPAERAAAQRILLQLVSAQSTRIRRSERELVDDAVARAALEALVRGRLVVAHDGDGAYEIAHEAL